MQRNVWKQQNCGDTTLVVKFSKENAMEIMNLEIWETKKVRKENEEVNCGGAKSYV